MRKEEAEVIISLFRKIGKKIGLFTLNPRELEEAFEPLIDSKETPTEALERALLDNSVDCTPKENGGKENGTTKTG